MKTNHGAVINVRMRENYPHASKKWTDGERAWAEKFERLEYAIERGFAREATRIAKLLNPSVSPEAIARIQADVETKDRCNPAKAEYDAARMTKRKTSDHAAHHNLYDPYDWHKTAGTILDDDGHETELGIATNPEDALVAALDAAAKHGVNLETFINNPKYHTPERKAGRPKKETEE